MNRRRTLQPARPTILLATGLAAALALTGCTNDGNDDPTDGPTVTVTIPSGGTSTEPSSPPTASATETDNHIDGGDPEDAPDIEQIHAAEQAARNFWIALTERTWDHPDGPNQWLAAVAPYTTPDYQNQLEDDYGDNGGGVEWDDFYFSHGTITAQVRTAAFDPGFPFDKTNITVVIEGASALQNDTYNLDVDDSPSQYRPVSLTLTDDGWKVSAYGNPPESE